MRLPSASTTSRPRTRSSIFPYLFDICPADRHASQPPTVERPTDWGQCPSVRECSVRSSSSRTSPKVPGRTSSTSDVVDIDDPREAGEVEDDPAVDGHGRTAHAAAARQATVGGTRASLQIAASGHFLDGAGSDDGRGTSTSRRRGPRPCRVATSPGWPRPPRPRRGSPRNRRPAGDRAPSPPPRRPVWRCVDWRRPRPRARSEGSSAPQFAIKPGGHLEGLLGEVGRLPPASTSEP